MIVRHITQVLPACDSVGLVVCHACVVSQFGISKVHLFYSIMFYMLIDSSYVHMQNQLLFLQMEAAIGVTVDAASARLMKAAIVDEC